MISRKGTKATRGEGGGGPALIQKQFPEAVQLIAPQVPFSGPIHYDVHTVWALCTQHKDLHVNDRYVCMTVLL